MIEVPLRSLYSEIHYKDKNPRLMTLDVEMHGLEPVFIFEMERADRWSTNYTYVGHRLNIDPNDPSVGRPVVATLVHISRTKRRVHIPLRKMEYIRTVVEEKICELLHCTTLHGDVITLDVNWNEETDMSWDFHTFVQAGVYTGHPSKDPLTTLLESMKSPT